jgi:hypothetical protein
MAILSFKLDQLFTLLVPELVVSFEVEGAVSFPDEPDFVQNSLSIKSNFVMVMQAPLLTNPHPKRCVILVPLSHLTMAILSFKL